MKALRFLAQAIFVSATLLGGGSAQAQTTDTNTTTIIGQWDFETNDLTIPTVGLPLQFIGGYQPTYTQQAINNRLAGAMSFPAASSTQGILARFASTNNGGGTNLNLYTVIMDVMWPPASEGLFRSIINTETNNTTDADMFVDPPGSIGVLNDYAGQIDSGLWYRLGLVFDLTVESNKIDRYLNGTNIGTITLQGNNIDGRFSLRNSVLFFSDNDGDTGEGFVSVIQVRAGAMTPEEMAALGSAGTAGLGEGGAPAGDISIQSITRSGNNVVITVANNGRTIQLEKTQSIVNPSWSTVNAVPTGSTFTVPMTPTHEFFRAKGL
ncbi:MAG: hypothetical protein ACXW32_03520 [Limisphaerales bacterium]